MALKRSVAVLAAAVIGLGALTLAQTPAPKTTAPAPTLTQAPPAQPILDNAVKDAARSGKSVFVHFSASWCGWCHKLEKFLTTPEGKELEPYMIDVMLVVQESPDKKMLEHPGAADIMK